MTACPQCSAANSPDARFCNQCGSRLGGVGYTPAHLAQKVLTSRAALQGEKKRVTVLFADVKGSTQLAEAVGAEAWHQILDGFFQRLSAAVHRFEGTVNQYTGDGIMALFGAPIAHEDHALRACRAALDMQQQVREYGNQLRATRGLNFYMRVGINSGEVVVGRIGDDLRMDYTAQGLTTHLAARMEQLCEPGHIYLTQHSAQQVQGYVRLRELGPMVVAGASAPIAVFALEGLGAHGTRLAHTLARGSSAFVGRNSELARLRSALAHVQQGGSACLAITGAAGLGKSRLCHEFLQEVAQLGLPTLYATGVSYGSAMPLLPVQTLARAAWGLADTTAACDARRLLAGSITLEAPEKAELIPALIDFLGLADADAPAANPQLRAPLMQLIAQQLLRGGPKVVLVEDLHFCDPQTLAFLNHYAQHTCTGTATLLLVNHRPEFSTPAALGPENTLSLSPLSTPQLQQLAQDCLGPQAAHLAPQLADRAAGNPFYVEEAVQMLVDDGHLTGQRGGYQLQGSISEWQVPHTVHALITARLDRLPEARKHLVQAAAVIGAQFTTPLLASLVQQPLAEVLSDCQALVKLGLFAADGEGFQLAHPLISEVAYHSQLEHSRQQLHAAVAQQIAQQHPQPDSQPPEAAITIAHHYASAGQWAEAGQWDMMATRWATLRDMRIALAHFRLAVQHYDRAAQNPATPHTPYPQYAQQRAAARAGIIRLAQFAEVSPQEVESCYHQALQLAGSDPAISAELMMSYGAERAHRGDGSGAAALAQQSIALACSVGAQALIGRFRISYLLILNGVGQIRQGIALINQASNGEWLGSAMSAENFISRGFHGLMLAELGELPQARQEIMAALAVAEQINVSVSWMHANLVELAWFTGDYRQALAQAHLALQKAEQFASPFQRGFALRALGLAHTLTGNPQAAIEILESARPLHASDAQAHQLRPAWLTSLGEAHCAAGQCSQARSIFEEAISHSRRSGSLLWELRALLGYLRLPKPAEPAAALSRLSELLSLTQAQGYYPHLLEAQARYTPLRRSALLAEAQAHYAAMGAQGHVRRLAQGQSQDTAA